MADQSERNTGNIVWAGVGLGILAGVAAGLFIAARQSRRKPDPLTGTVEDLRQRAERVLAELSSSVAQIAQQANAGVAHTAQQASAGVSQTAQQASSSRDEQTAEPIGSS